MTSAQASSSVERSRPGGAMELSVCDGAQLHGSE